MDLVDPDDLPRLLEAYEQVLSAPGASVTLDLQVQQADDDWADIELTAVNLLEDPSVGGIVITSRNITQRKQIEAELGRRRDEALEQSRLRAEFVARVSHELRNQLHALRGLTELLSTTEVPRSVAQLVETVHRQSEQFEHLVDDLLEYSHIEADRLEPRAVPCWPRQLVADAVAVGRELAAAGVDVSGHADEAVADVVLLDERRVRQVLTNLVSNAAKFTRDGRIEVHVEHVEVDGDAGLRWRVRDTGRGILESDLDRIFQPFEQGQAGAAAGGAGLGLAITDRIVVALGGRLGVESTAGEGSEFHVVLPAPVTDALPAIPALPMARMRPRSHVLVVEDNPVNQMLVAEQLSRLGAAGHRGGHRTRGARGAAGRPRHRLRAHGLATARTRWCRGHPTSPRAGGAGPPAAHHRDDGQRSPVGPCHLPGRRDGRPARQAGEPGGPGRRADPVDRRATGGATGGARHTWCRHGRVGPAGRSAGLGGAGAVDRPDVPA